MTDTLLTARWVIGFAGGTHVVHENGCVLMRENRIVHVGAVPEPLPDAWRIDYGEAILSPGFIDLDALSDLDSTILGLDNFPGWQKGRVWPDTYVTRGPYEMYSPEELAFQKRFSFAALIRNGITTALPIASLFYREWGETVAEFDAAADAAEDLGLRAYLGPAFRTGGQVVDTDGVIRAIYDEPRGLAGLEDAASFASRIDGRAQGRIRAMFAPDRIETCTPTLLTCTAEIAGEMGAPVRQHCLQSETELRLVRDQHGVSPIRYLADNDALGPNWLLPHGTHATETDMSMIRDSGAALVHCPLVAARHGGLLQSLPRWLDMGIAVGMGTDTWPPDMIVNMQLGLMTARIVDGHDAIRSETLFDAATLGGARALRRDDIGRLAKGAKADVTVIDLATALQTTDPVQTIMASCSGRDVRDVWIDGRRVMADRVIPGVDEAAETARAQAQFARMVAKYPDRTLGHPPLSDIFRPSYERVTHDRHRS
ncbi:MAG: amidohydrolase family protein [Spiribacter salinus]|uniref:Amidohydrolase family protein n=1 Tax=Spiribacter salinus TaxID=1335746 RepID=A0A540VRB1_9GAMM|nr:MAG: amidohydrolase family protein [Spiribacter salinus]